MTRTMCFLGTWALVLVLAPFQTWALTLSFDDVPTGTPLREYEQLNVWFDSTFEAADHFSSAWGPPRSGHNVLINNWSSGEAMLKFGYLDNGLKLTRIYRLGGYFSTQPGVVLELVAFAPGLQVCTAYVGDAGTSWNNRYLEVVSPEGLISGVMLYPVSSADALLHWCVDDLTIEFVPEPSSLASLSLAVLAAGAGVRWRRRR